MKFIIKKAVGNDDSVDFLAYASKENEEDQIAILEFPKEDDHYVSEKSMAALRSLIELEKGDDSFAGAVEHVVEEAFRAGVNHVLSKEELSALIRDLIRITRAVKDGFHPLAIGELESVINSLMKKDMSDKKYTQIVWD